jgi:Tol biopolymer transport system component
MRLAASLLLFSAACGRLEFATLDASTGDGRATDAELPNFNVPVLIAEVSDPLTDDDPTITGDGLELYFASERGGAATGYADIYVSTRVTTFSAWTAPVPVVELNSTDEDQSPGITPDGLTMYFSSRRPTASIPGGSSNTWISTRPNRTTPWSAPQLVLEVSSTMEEFEPQPDTTNTRLVFYRQVGATDRDLFIANRESTTLAWDTPTPMADVNTTAIERSPFLSADNQAIWFSSDRESLTSGVNDIFIATRMMPSESFGVAVAQTELNTPFDDDDPCLSADGRIIVFTSNATGNYEIYEARR